MEKATGSEPEAALISKGAMVDVMAYITRKNNDTTAAMLKVLNDSQMTVWRLMNGKPLKPPSKADTPPLCSAEEKRACQ